MTCFWDGILQKLNTDDFRSISIGVKPRNRNFVNVLKIKNTKTIGMKWNNKYITKQQIDENFTAIKEYNAHTMYNGYFCSTFEPFLFLVSYIFKCKIIHNYMGHTMTYEPPVVKKTLRFSSDRGHFWAN